MVYSTELHFIWYVLCYGNFSRYYNAVNPWLSELMGGEARLGHSS